MSPADAATLMELAQRYALAYTRAKSPETRSAVSVKHKNVVRREVWEIVRPIAMRIKRHRGIDDGQKIALGIYPSLRGQSRIKAPSSAPQLEVLKMQSGVQRLRFRDPANPTRFRKPYGAVALQLLIKVARRRESSPDGAKRVKHVTRHVFDMKFTPQETGKTATYFARWVTRRGRTGPWSRALAVTIV
jgi:hypothetical protein